VRQVRVRVTCDACAAWHETDTEDGVETVPVGSQTLDLCPSHRRDLAPLLALVAEWGAAPGELAPTSRKRPAHVGIGAVLVPQEQARKGSKQRGGARARKRRENGAQAAADSVNTCPMCGLQSVSRSALMQHTRRAHQTTLAELEASSS
jgi:transcription elongation factor Elf1